MHVRSARELGLVVREARHAQKLTQAQLAVRAGVTREWIVGIERGNRGAEVERVLQLLAALKLRVDVTARSIAVRKDAGGLSRIDAIVARAARRPP